MGKTLKPWPILVDHYSRSTIYKFMADETDFPKSVPLGGRAVAWVESEIEEWM
ncbi:AlpA family phage regulatory protein, partial [Vibrio cholerae]|uniref:AlpA family phage regulatory protein n=1 Tax=Vibrio cholerae TaxID=666 RepID=UPI002934D0CB